MKLLSSLHGRFARLHSGMQDDASVTAAAEPGRSDEIKAAYAEYAAATAHANAMLQTHGPASPQFASADVASMRLFHRVKKMQGLRKPRGAG